MAFQITYARLFQLNIQHAYYLNVGEDAFHALDPAGPDATRRLGNYDLRQLLQIEPLADTVASLRGHRMKVAHDNQGFFVGISVQERDGGGLEAKLMPKPGTTWHFGLKPNQPLEWNNATNQQFRPPFPAIYYFSNLRTDLADSGSNLSMEVADHNPQRVYEADQYVRVDGALYRALSSQNTGTSPPGAGWSNPIEDHREVNAHDRVLLPQKFKYLLQTVQGFTPTELKAQLKNLDGEVVQEDIFSSISGQQGVFLNYSIEDAQGWYDLEITLNNSVTTTHRICINEQLYDPGLWGVISIGHASDLPAPLRLFEADARLREEAGQPSTALFQIRIPNRNSYWRYHPHPSQELKPADATALVLTDGGSGNIETRAPQPLTRYGNRVDYLAEGADDSLVLPSPTARSLIPDPNGRLYSDVYLGVLNL